MREEVLERAIENYGKDHQVLKCVEELAELQKAIMDYVLRSDGLRPIVSEMADVIIMLKQIELMFGLTDGINREIEFKVNRLERRINESTSCSE